MAITRATSVACFVLVSAAAPPPPLNAAVVVVVFIQAGPEPKYYFIMPKEVAMSTRKGHALPFSTAAALRQFSLFLSLLQLKVATILLNFQFLSVFPLAY